MISTTMTPRPSSLANRLWTTRRKRGLSRKRLAGLLGHKTTSQLCRWKQGTQVPTLAHALLLGYLLQLPIEMLFQGLRHELVLRMQQRHEGFDAQAAGEDLTQERIIEA
jgi:transcriptional regulator with XRE-family HTH domain